MQGKSCLRAAVLLAVGVAGWLAVAGAARAEIYVGRLIAEDLFDRLKFSGRIAVWPLDAAQAGEVGLTTSAAAALGDKIRTEVQHLGAAKGFSFVEREAISKVFQEQQFAHGAKESDFEILARRANADALVLISIHRKDRAELVVSARLVRARGSAVGEVVVTSRTYEVAMAEASLATAEPAQGGGAAAVKPDTVTPTGGATSTYGAYYPYVTAYPAYTYTAPAYYVQAPAAVPAYPVGYVSARWGWRR